MLCSFQTELCGWGVEAAEPINKGEFIVEYIGEGSCLSADIYDLLDLIFLTVSCHKLLLQAIFYEISLLSSYSLMYFQIKTPFFGAFLSGSMCILCQENTMYVLNIMLVILASESMAGENGIFVWWEFH